MSGITHREDCPCCGLTIRSSTGPFPPFQPVPVTEDVRRDLWRFFGEPNPDLMQASWPALPDSSVRFPRTRLPELQDTPFVRAFLVWRERQRRRP